MDFDKRCGASLKYMMLLLFHFFLVFGRVSTTSILDVEVISTIPYNISVGVALPFTGAALQVAVEAVNDQFAGDLNISFTLLYNKADTICDYADVNALLLAAEYYNTKARNRCVAFINSGQSPEWLI